MNKAGAYKLQETLWLISLISTPLLVNLWVEQQFEASKIWLLRTLIWASLLLWIASWFRGEWSRSLPQPIPKLIIALIAMISLSTLFSANHYIALMGSLDRAAGSLTQISYIVFFFTVATSLNRQRCQFILYSISLTAIPICLFALAQSMGWQPLALFTDARTPLTTTLGRSNFTGAYLALILPLSFIAFLLARTIWQRFGYGLLVVMEIAVLFLTQARSAWLAAACGVIVLFWFCFLPGKGRYIVYFGMLTLMLGGVLFSQQIPNIINNGSIAARLTIWRASLDLLWSRLWLGYGADTLGLFFPSVYPPELVYYQGRGITVDRAHSWLLDWSLNYGVLTTTIFVLLIIIILRRGYNFMMLRRLAHAKFQTNDNHEYFWLAACIAGVCTQLCGNLFLFDVASTAVVFWFLLAVILTITSDHNSQVFTVSFPPWLRYSGNGLGLILFLWAVWLCNIQPMIADTHVWRGTHALNEGNPATALQKYTTAVEIQPNRAEYQLAVALTAASQNDFAGAYQFMQRAISLYPTDPTLYIHLATIYAHESKSHPEKVQSAYSAYRRAIALAPTIAISYRQFADFALRSVDWQEALNMSSKAILLDETDGKAFGIAGWSYLHFGKKRESQNMFEKAVKWSPNSADYHLGLATVLFQQNKILQAKEALEKSLIINPTYEPSLTLQRQLGR